MVCFRVCTWGWKGKTPREVLAMVTASNGEPGGCAAQFTRVREHRVAMQADGRTRVHVTPSVTATARNDSRVESAPFRWITVADYPKAHPGHTAAGDGHEVV